MRPACSLVWIWLMPGNTYSTGSSTVVDVLAGRVDLEQRGVQRGGLAGAGRAGADAPCRTGRGPSSSSARRSPRGKPSWPRPIIERLLSRIRMTIFSPNTVATRRTRTSSSLAVDDRSRTGRPADGASRRCSSPLMILRRLIERGVDADRQLERLDEVTVDAEPDAQPVVERLDVDVRAAVAHGLADDPVDELRRPGPGRRG